MQEVKQVYDYLQQNPDFSITVHGHTDNVGTSGYNQGLSENRCKVVTEYLIGLGLPPSRVSWVGQGGSSPIASNETEVGRQQNRRVAFVLSRH